MQTNRAPIQAINRPTEVEPPRLESIAPKRIPLEKRLPSLATLPGAIGVILTCGFGMHITGFALIGASLGASTTLVILKHCRKQ